MIYIIFIYIPTHLLNKYRSDVKFKVASNDRENWVTQPIEILIRLLY